MLAVGSAGMMGGVAYSFIPTALPLLSGEPHSSPQHNRGVQLPFRGNVRGDKAAESHRGEVLVISFIVSFF